MMIVGEESDGFNKKMQKKLKKAFHKKRYQKLKKVKNVLKKNKKQMSKDFKNELKKV